MTDSLAGMKSYGRAPTFLMRTGYEQVRSIIAAIGGDRAGAERVELVLPETGVCRLSPPTAEQIGCVGSAKTDGGASGRAEVEGKAQSAKSCGHGSDLSVPATADPRI